MSKPPHGNIIIDTRRDPPTVGARFRYRHGRPYIAFGRLPDWPEDKIRARVDAIQRDINAGLVVPELEEQLKRAGRAEAMRKRLARERRPFKDPVGYAYSYSRRVLQALGQFRDSTPSRDHRLLALDAITKGHAFEDAIAALVRATYDVPPYGSENGNGHGGDYKRARGALPRGDAPRAEDRLRRQRDD